MDDERFKAEAEDILKKWKAGVITIMKTPPYRCTWCHEDVIEFTWIGNKKDSNGLSWKTTCSDCGHETYT